MGEDMHVKGQRLFGKSLCLPLFCCEPKTILKTKIFTKKKNCAHGRSISIAKNFSADSPLQARDDGRRSTDRMGLSKSRTNNES